MYIEFELPIKAFSVNRMNHRDARYKTAEFKDWYTVLLELLADVPELRDFAPDFKRTGGVFHVWFTVVYPFHIYYNKSQQVSAKTFDVSNTEKPILDAVFRDTLGIDDRYVTKLVSAKEPGGSYKIRFALEFRPNV